jgi:serine protease AprX
MRPELARWVAAIGAVLATVTSSHAADAPEAGVTWRSKIHPRVLADTAEGRRASAVVLLVDQADLSVVYGIADPDARGWYVYRTLKAHAARTQLPLRRWLRARRVHYRAFWAANMLVVDADRDLVEALAVRTDTRMIESNAPIRGVDDPPTLAQPAMTGTAGVEWGVSDVNAPAVWAMGYTGQGIVIAVQDSGMQWDHPALQPHYRGWNGSSADHNYNWHDAIHDAVGNPCGNDAPAPCDDNGHGTHTTGTTSGDDGLGNHIGVAPGARWIGCRNMDRGDGTPARYTECFQFFIAPTDQSGNNPDPTKRPHVMSNSWGCPPSEGCAANTLETIVSNAEAAGIFVVAAAGNAGPNCGSVNDPPPIYASAFSVGAYDVTNTLADFSSRGPVTVDGSERMKPEIAAPGVNVRSAYPINTYISMQGTSMASPHVAGVVALLWSAQPQLARDIATTKALLESTANPGVTVSPSQTCGETSSDTIPNNSFGYGRVDALAAVDAVLLGSPTPTPSATTPPVSATPTVTPTRAPSATATPTPTPSSSPPPTATAIVGVAGQVVYFSNPSLPVGGAVVQLQDMTQGSGSAAMVTQTDSTGQFSFPGIGVGDWEVQPQKLGDFGNAVDIVDAVYTLEATVGSRTLSAPQRLACDVNGDGSVGIVDAVLILQHVVGLTPRFPVAQACNSDWAFMPDAAAAPNQQIIQPQPGSTCQPGAICYQPLLSEASSQNFSAVVFGDCNGSWQPSSSSAQALSVGTGESGALRLGRAAARRGHRVDVPLLVAGTGGIRALSAEMSYDPAQLRAPKVRAVGVARQALMQVNLQVAGSLRLALAGTRAVQDGIVAVLEFDAPRGQPSRGAIRIQNTAVTR